MQVTNALNKLPGCWGRWSWVCPWGSQPQSLQWQWDSHRVVDSPPAAPSSPPDIEWVRRNHENSLMMTELQKIIYYIFTMMHNSQVFDVYGSYCYNVWSNKYSIPTPNLSLSLSHTHTHTQHMRSYTLMELTLTNQRDNDSNNIWNSDGIRLLHIACDTLNIWQEIQLRFQ